MLETPYDGADVWDLRNGYATGDNNSSSLYGWRQGGDYGLLGSPGGSAPATGTYVPYPTYFAEQLASKIIQAGGNVVQASSSDPNLTVYAVLEPNGHLDLLVINKSASSALTGQFQLAGFPPAAQAQVWQYGEAQDTAQSQTSDGHSALANFTATLTVSGSTFSYSFPAYSMTVLDLGKASSGTAGPTITKAASATPSPVTGTTTVLSVTATDPSGNSGLDLHLGDHRHAPCARHLQRQRHQCRPERHRDLLEGGLVHLPGHRDRPGRLHRDQQRHGHREPDPERRSRSAPARSRSPASGQQQFSGIAQRPVRQPDEHAAGAHLVGLERFGTIGATHRALHGPERGRNGHRARPPSGGISGTASVTDSGPADDEHNAWRIRWSHPGAPASRRASRSRTPARRRSTAGRLQFDFAATITQIWNATIVEPYRQPLRDPERRLQQHDRPGPERIVRLPGQPRRRARRHRRITS